MTTHPQGSKTIEVWHQDNQNQDLWHGHNSVMVNTAALKEREAYVDIVCIPSASFIPLEDLISPSPFH